MQDKSTIAEILFSQRSSITVMCFLAFALHTIMRNVINVAQVCMLERNNDTNNVTSSINIRDGEKPKYCRLNKGQLTDYDGNLPWQEQDLDHLIAVLGWGRLVAVLPISLLADRFDSAVVLFYAMFSASLSTFLFPVAALLHGYVPTLILRLVQGMTYGAQPCLSALITHWSPHNELSSRLIFTLSGQHLSNFLLNIVVARFCSLKQIFGGWPIGFLSSGVLGLLWCVFWWKLGANNPEKHEKVSDKEMTKILLNREFKMEDKKAVIHTFPWCSAIFSKASLACLLCETSGTFGVACVVYYFPRYARDVLGLQMYANGLVTGIPNLLEFFCRLSFNFLAEYLRHGCKMNKTLVMKSFNTFGMFSIALLLYFATFIDCARRATAVALIVSAQALYGATSPGFLVSQVLIAPRYAGIMAGWFALFSSASMIGLPYLVAYLVPDSTDVLQWRAVFGIGCVMQLFSALVFLIYGSADEQSWAKSSGKLMESKEAAEDFVEKVTDDGSH
uniref:Uncharacterized protein n=1 Tax=Romanomermis culicivorax TaxID=13658 RepID=A0A915HXV8_ROMCU